MSRPSGAEDGGPGQHALPQGRHQGGAEVSWGMIRLRESLGLPIWSVDPGFLPLVFVPPGSILWSLQTQGSFLRTM